MGFNIDYLSILIRFFMFQWQQSVVECLCCVLQHNIYLCVSEGGARGRWKALKAESRSGVEETEALLRSLQERIQQIHDRRDALTQLVQELHSKVSRSAQP